MSKSIRKYLLYYGIAVSGLSKEDGVKVSQMIAYLLNRDGGDCYEAAKFLLAQKYTSTEVLQVKYGKGVRTGDNKVFTVTLTGKVINTLASHVNFIASFRDEANFPAKQIAGSKEETRKGNTSKSMTPHNYHPVRKPAIKEASLPEAS